MPEKKGNWQIKRTTVVLIAAVVFVILATILLPNQDIRPASAAGEDIMNEVEGYWWAPNGGWIALDWDAVNEQDVQINKSTIPNALFTGYAWGPNIGWISMAGSQYQVRIRENIDLKGPGPWPIDNYAWGPNIGWLDFDAIDAWTHPPGQQWHGGTISADEPQLKVNATVPEDADMSGYAWSPNFGWINLSFATVPGWKDTTAPVLNYFEVMPENDWPDPLKEEKYAGGVYLDAYDYSTAYHNFLGGGQHFAWVKSGIDFKVNLHSVDTRERWHSLNISELAKNDAPPPNQYFWWDRIKFMPDQTPNYIGHPISYDARSGFNPNSDYPNGENPAAEGDVPDGNTWKSVTHFTTTDPVGGVVAREFRYNLRDAAGNRACTPTDTFSWQKGEGCVIPSMSDPNSMWGRVGVAIDNVVPSGLLSVGGIELSIKEDEPTFISKAEGIDFTATYIDTDSGAYRVIVDYSRKLGNMWEPWAKDDEYHYAREIGERHFNVGRETTNWVIDDTPDEGAEEYPLDTSSWSDAQEFQVRLRIFDNVGNRRERFFYAKINVIPPLTGSFTANDPIDQDPSRTRYAAADLKLPANATISLMRFANTPNGPWSPPDKYDTYPKDGGWKDNWDLNFGNLDPNASVTGGLKTIYADFCDQTQPNPVCTHDHGVVVKAQINAPWFEGAQGDIYGKSGVGTSNPQFNGIAPYLGVDVQKYNATYRITSGGEIKPQITSARGEGWTESNYYSAFGFPGMLSTIAPIDFESLKNDPDTKTMKDNVVANNGELDFGTGGIILLKSGSLVPNSDPVLYSNKSDRLVIKGRGTLLVEGNLRIINDLYYEDNPAVPDEPDDPDYNVIDSMAVLTSRTAPGCRGNVYVGDNVAHLVGAYIVGLEELDGCPISSGDNIKLGSGTFHSSVRFLASSVPSPGNAKINPGSWPFELKPTGRELVVEGMVAARDFNLGRYSTGNKNFLTNGDLENNPVSCPPGWSCAPQVLDRFIPSSDNVVTGNQKLQIKLLSGQTGTLKQNDIPVDLAGKTSLTLSGYLRSNFKRAPTSAIDAWVGNQPCLFQPGDKDISIDSQWRRFQCTVSVDSKIKSVGVTMTAKNRLRITTILDLDTWQLEASDEATEWHDKFNAADTNYMASERFYYDGRVVISTPPGLASTSGSSWKETVAD